VKTQIVPTATAEQLNAAVRLAVEHLRRGEVVALPTETVYGLAANALNADAALKIFEAKERPLFDPLIVHLPDREWLDRVTEVAAEDAELVARLADRLWPGPLTFVLKRRSVVPDVVTAGLETVAVRISAHPVFSAIVRAFGPLAAPSANRFGRISPTSADHVLSELDTRVPLIVDGGRTMHGIESTIIAVRNGRIQILRHGPITHEQLSLFADITISTTRERPEAPGQLRSHYAPRTPLVLVQQLKSFRAPTGKRVGGLSLSDVNAECFDDYRVLSRTGDIREAAANLFRCLRELDAAKLDLIVAEELPESGLGTAVNDRLRRAAAVESGLKD
jgi:L-threonylcarbamoyladenylate synthase